MRKPRKNYTPSEKVAILRRHLIDRVPVSDLCDEYQLSPTLFYAWQKLFFENGPRRFERKNESAEQATSADHRRAAGEAPAQERGRRGIDGRTYPTKKRAWGTLTKAWVPHDVRDAIVDYVAHWSERTEIPVQRFVAWLGVAASKFYDWRARYGTGQRAQRAWFPATGGSRTGRRRPSSTSTPGIPSKATAGSPS